MALDWSPPSVAQVPSLQNVWVGFLAPGPTNSMTWVADVSWLLLPLTVQTEGRSPREYQAQV